MSDLRFQRLLLVSNREQRARSVEFDPVATVIKGSNDVGKSSIAKSIYASLGAPPPVLHPRWQLAAVSTLLEFTVDGAAHAILREGRTYSLFSGSSLLGSFTSVTNELGPAISKLLGFNLKLTDRAGVLQGAPPAYLFLPFYCDQDKGWSDAWASFDRLQQFPKWKGEVINYHVGITTPAYYDALDKLNSATQERIAPIRERETLLRLQKRAQMARAADIDIEFDATTFAAEITELVERAEALAEDRQRRRQTLAKLSEERLQLVAQREILERVRRELHADYEFATEVAEDEVECPTCGQLHQNSFMERFAIAQDEAKTGDLTNEILDRIVETEQKLSTARISLKDLTSEEDAVQELLQRKRGQVTLAEVLEREGHKALSSQLDSQLRELDHFIALLDARIESAKEDIAAIKSPEKRRAVLDEYLQSMRAALRELEVTSLAEVDYERLDFALKETGSDRPRAILAYMFSILRLIWNAESSARCPIVLDSPNQQDQDPDNHKRMLHFIRDNRPANSQLILFAVDDCGIEMGGATIVLEERDFALSREEYDEVSKQFLPYRLLRDA